MSKIREGATIKVHVATRERLKSIGHKGETYDAIINRLIDQGCRLKTRNQEEKT